jgi:hypothetical protein
MDLASGWPTSCSISGAGARTSAASSPPWRNGSSARWRPWTSPENGAKGGGREDKIAAIGVRIKRWVTLHGIALNVDCDLSHYAGIVPCGVSEPRYGVTSLADLGIATTLAEIDALLQREFEELFGPFARGHAAAERLVSRLPAT